MCGREVSGMEKQMPGERNLSTFVLVETLSITGINLRASREKGYSAKGRIR